MCFIHKLFQLCSFDAAISSTFLYAIMKIKHTLTSTLALIASAALLPVTAGAATASGSLEAKITITSDCSVSTGNAALDFGSNASTAAMPTANNGGFSVTCTNGSPYKIGLTPASTSSAVGTGTMSTSPSNGSTIGYTLYQDSSFQTVWGSTAGTNTNDSTGTGAAQSYTVYGKVTSSLNVPAGNYSDTVTIEVTY